ncbi:hypothetical protein V6Z11_A03G079400 [Gossypium hirsutum]
MWAQILKIFPKVVHFIPIDCRPFMGTVTLKPMQIGATRAWLCPHFRKLCFA